MAAEIVVDRLADLETDNMESVTKEVALRPERWRNALRDQVRARDKHSAPAGRLLEITGSAEDIVLLRDYARHLRGALRDPELARRLARPWRHGSWSKTLDG